MVQKSASRSSHKRQYAVAVASAFAISTCAIAAFAEAPAFASQNAKRASFDTAFASFELTEQDAALSPAAILAAESRFDNAPVDEPEESVDVIGSGNASYYGARFAGRSTASGETFDPSALTAAHRTLPFGTKVKVTNPRNGRSVVVRINDRGPFHGNRVIDLSRAAADELGLIKRGHGYVRLAQYTS